MAINLKKGGSGTSERPVDGTYLARLISIVDLDHQPAFHYGEGSTAGVIDAGYKISLTYELVSTKNSKDENFLQTEELTMSLNERANLSKRLKALDPSGIKTKNHTEIDGVMGSGCMLTVGSTGKGGAKVAGLTSPIEGLPIPNATITVGLFSFDEPDMDVYSRIPSFIQGKLHKSTNFENSPLHLELLQTGWTMDQANSPY
tara:strand:+ start:193 stop:798 length:606 start_codon:yes stop_codon:yes gene_type:complete